MASRRVTVRRTMRIINFLKGNYFRGNTRLLQFIVRFGRRRNGQWGLLFKGYFPTGAKPNGIHASLRRPFKTTSVTSSNQVSIFGAKGCPSLPSTRILRRSVVHRPPSLYLKVVTTVVRRHFVRFPPGRKMIQVTRPFHSLEVVFFQGGIRIRRAVSHRRATPSIPFITREMRSMVKHIFRPSIVALRGNTTGFSYVTRVTTKGARYF